MISKTDCCPADESGDESFKGVVSFPPTLVSKTIINNCTYNPSSTSSRQCRGNLKDGPQWQEVDFVNCSAKSNVTNNLIKLSKVKLCTDDNDVGKNGCQTPVEVSGNLSKLIESGENITTRQDLEYIGEVLKGLANSTAFSPNNTADDAKKVSYRSSFSTMLSPY